VVRRDPRAPGFLGDLPHTWVASDFIRSFLDLFAYERDADHALVLAAGVPAAWLARPQGIAVRKLRTPWGPLSYTLARRGSGVRYWIAAGLEIPPGGIVLSWPLLGTAAGGMKVVRRLPAVVDLVAAAPRPALTPPTPSLPASPPATGREGDDKRSKEWTLFFSLLSRRLGGRLGEEGRGGEGRVGGTRRVGGLR